jgi:hypothetical protein
MGVKVDDAVDNPSLFASTCSIFRSEDVSGMRPGALDASIDCVLELMEVMDKVVAIVRTEDKCVMAKMRGTSIHILEIAPHVISGIGSADETVIATCGCLTR